LEAKAQQSIAELEDSKALLAQVQEELRGKDRHAHALEQRLQESQRAFDDTRAKLEQAELQIRELEEAARQAEEAARQAEEAARQAEEATLLEKDGALRELRERVAVQASILVQAESDAEGAEARLRAELEAARTAIAEYDLDAARLEALWADKERKMEGRLQEAWQNSHQEHDEAVARHEAERERLQHQVQAAQEEARTHQRSVEEHWQRQRTSADEAWDRKTLEWESRLAEHSRQLSDMAVLHASQLAAAEAPWRKKTEELDGIVLVLSTSFLIGPLLSRIFRGFFLLSLVLI
jgi:hypothetical protein